MRNCDSHHNLNHNGNCDLMTGSGALSNAFFRGPRVEKMDFQLEHLEMEFEAETWWFCSTHEGYKTTKFQLQTPSRSAPTGNPFYPKKKIAKKCETRTEIL